MLNSSSPDRNWQFATLLLLLLVTAWLYGPAVDFGFSWDDPLWYSRMVGKSVLEFFRPMSDYSMYRPGTMLYHSLFLTSDGTFAVPLLHAAQIGWHLLNIALVYTLSRRLRLGGWTALAVSGMVALYPFSHQAVAWAAPQQPLVAVLQNGAWLAYVEARQRRAGRLMAAGLSLSLFLVALTAQESTVALSALPLLVEWVLRRRDAGGVSWLLALVYPLVAAGFGLLWLWLPRQSGYISLAFDGQAALYLLQGFIFPLLGRPAGYSPDQAVAPGALLAIGGLTIGGLLVAAQRTGRGRQALLGLVWALLGIAPSIAGLRYSVVSVGPRLLYYSSPGVAMLWACGLLPGSETRFLRKNLVSLHRLWRTGGAVTLGLIALQSGLLLTDFQRMYAVGATHLAELIQAAQAGEDRMLFVNFPDRYTPKRPPYPLGYWGMTLAPVSVDLGAFPSVTTGQRPHTVSRSMPWIDAHARQASPYQTDMRGIVAYPDQIYQLACQANVVYLSRYLPDGDLALQWAGTVTPAAPTPSLDSTPICRLAVFGQTLCLQEAQVDVQPGQLNLTLTWRSLAAAQPHDTIFAHLGLTGHPPIAQADNDAWLGILPLVTWQPGDTIREQRIIPIPEDSAPGHYEIQVGVYNRVTGERLPATAPQGAPLPDNAVTIGYLSQ